MDMTLDLTILKYAECLEPEVGAELVPLYPLFLSAEEKQQFEQHLETCEYCQELRKFWRVTGVSLGIKHLLEQGATLLRQQHYTQAIACYNCALELEPGGLGRSASQVFFQTDAWCSITAATLNEQDLMPYIFPSYAPGEYKMAAATPEIPFPIIIEYADGQVKGKFFAAGTSVFFEVFEALGDFAENVILVGQISQPIRSLKVWEILPGKKYRLGTITSLFGAQDLQHVANTLRTFKVFTTTTDE